MLNYRCYEDVSVIGIALCISLQAVNENCQLYLAAPLSTGKEHMVPTREEAE
jgi:hypothetical protein